MRWISKIFLAFAVSASIWANLGFQVGHVRLHGLVNVSSSTLKSLVDVHAGDRVTNITLQRMLRRIYAAGFFRNVQLGRQGDDLVVQVQEFPVIAFVGFSGNNALKKEQIEAILAKYALVAGKPYKLSHVDQAKKMLRQAAQAQGIQSLKVESRLEQMGRQRLRLYFDFNESAPAKVAAINFIGNHAISTSVLRGVMALRPKFWSFLLGNNDYSELRLKKDLFVLQAYYADHGYPFAHVKKRSITFNKERTKVDLLLAVDEGQRFVFGDISWPNFMLHKRPAELKSGHVFGRVTLIEAIQLIKAYYLNRGYAHVSVTPRLSFDPAGQRVSVKFAIHKGPLTLVRHIHFFGNTQTHDEVLRREMLQHESEIYSSRHVAESVRRINTLGYLRNARCQTVNVKGHQDVVDLDCYVTESATLSLSASVGLSSSNGVLLQLAASHKNWLGTGYGGNFKVMRSAVGDSISIGLFNPYFFPSGVSQRLSLSYEDASPARKSRKPMLDRSKLKSSYSLKRFKLGMDYGLPISEHSRLMLGSNMVRYTVRLSDNVDPSFSQYINDYGNRFDALNLHVGWHYNALNSAIFPTSGSAVNLDAIVGLPIDDWLSYYKINMSGSYYLPIGASGWVGWLRGGIGYGRGFGDRGKTLPFFLNYFLGGLDNVRGFAPNSIGRHDAEGRAIGGSTELYGSAAVVLPQWFSKDIRMSVFVDAGKIADQSLNAAKTRASAGVSLQWRTALVPLVFSLATPIDSVSGDEKEVFAFQLGTMF